MVLRLTDEDFLNLMFLQHETILINLPSERIFDSYKNVGTFHTDVQTAALRVGLP